MDHIDTTRLSDLLGLLRRHNVKRFRHSGIEIELERQQAPDLDVSKVADQVAATADAEYAAWLKDLGLAGQAQPE